MRILIFSDTHLTAKFDQNKFKFLEKIISEADQVIINGDFWDGYIVSFDEFVKSEWSKLFTVLKNKKASYLYGNHDQKEFTDKRVSEFSVDQSDRIFLKTHTKEFVIEHGNKYLPFIDERVSRDFIPKLFAEYTLEYESFLVRYFGTALIQNLYKKYNEEIKERIKTTLNKSEFLVCGHTHLTEVDLPNRFVNSGLINYGLGQYLIIDGEKIIQKEFWYDPPKIEEALDPELYLNYTKRLDVDSVK